MSTSPAESASTLRERWLWGGVLFLILLTAWILRWATSVTGYVSTFDTGTPGLMAVDILHGGRPLFFYGQSYMGALESYSIACLFKIFGFSETVKTMAPILYSLVWLLAMYALFTELFGRRVGIAAALTVAFCGWQTLWYNIGTYGGYPETFLFGTLVLWLSVRVLKRSIRGALLYLYIPLIGAFAGLGIWTNYLCAAYLLSAFFLLLIHRIRVLSWRSDWGPYVLALLPFTLAVLPVLGVFFRGESGTVSEFRFEDQAVYASYFLMRDVLIPELLFWPFQDSRGIRILVASLPVFAALFALLGLRAPEKDIQRRWFGVVVLFSTVFLLLYLPHSMATVKASRYLIPIVSMSLAWMFGLGLICRWAPVRGLAAGGLIAWCGLNAFSAVHMMSLRIPHTIETRSQREALIELCREQGVQRAMMAGGSIYGHVGQIYSFLSQGDIRFSSAYDERVQADAQAMETQLPWDCVVRSHEEWLYRRSLVFQQADFQRHFRPATTLLQGVLAAPLPSSRLLSVDTMMAYAPGQSDRPYPELLDRMLDTARTGNSGEGFELDLGSPQPVQRFWLSASDPVWQKQLPTGYEVQGSLDGENWFTILGENLTIPVSYNQNRRLYLLGYFGIMERRFDPVEARYLRFSFDSQRPWLISECYIFVSAESEVPDWEDSSLSEILDRLQSEGVQFLATDRWLSGCIFQHPEAGVDVYPRYNPKFPETRISREISFKPGWALAPVEAVADECERLIREVWGEDAVLRSVPLGPYRLILLNSDLLSRTYRGTSPLIWNGHAVIRYRGTAEAF